MHDFLQELRAPIAFAIIAFVVWVTKRIIKSEIGDHTDILQKEIRDHATKLAVMQTEIKAAWRHIDRINSGHDEEE